MADEDARLIRIVQCGNGDDCPSIRRGANGGFEVTGPQLDRPSLPEGEASVWVPDELLPELANLVIDDLGAWIGTRHKRDLLLDRLASDAEHGRIRRNVHIVEQPLSDYLRYQFEWCYVYNVAAGQDVRVLDISSNTAAAHLTACGDFAVLEGIDVARNQYTPDGAFLGAVQAPADTAAALAALGETAWAMAVPFTTWWRDHPQYHRANRAA